MLRFPLTEAIVDATRAGMGIAVLSAWIASAYVDGSPSGLVLKRLKGQALERPWRIAFRRDKADAAGKLAAAISGGAPVTR